MEISYKTAKLGEIIGYPFHTIPNVPTQSNLQKWLRDTKKILVEARPIDSWDSWTYYIWGKDDMAPFFQIYPHSDEDPFEGISYEEALEEGLYNALKFITP